jgi:hypothetical protein
MMNGGREREARGRPRRRWGESFGFQALRCPIREVETKRQYAGMLIADGVTECVVLSIRRCLWQLVPAMQRTPQQALVLLCSRLWPEASFMHYFVYIVLQEKS